MRRNEDLFEKKLIDNGWKLHSKEYYGKHSQFVLCYVYEKRFEFSGKSLCGYVRYRKVDKKVLDVIIDNVFRDKIDAFAISDLSFYYDNVNGEVMQLKYDTDMENYDE